MVIRCKKRPDTVKQLTVFGLLVLYLFIISTVNLFHTCSHSGGLCHRNSIYCTIEKDNSNGSKCTHSFPEYQARENQWDHNTNVCLACVFLKGNQSTNVCALLTVQPAPAMEFASRGQTVTPYKYDLSIPPTRAPPVIIF